MKRGTYGELVSSELEPDVLSEVRAMVKEASSADKVDEHGSWDFGAAFDRKGRGESLNWDIYGVGWDVHDGQLLAVIQVRQFRRTKYTQVRKNYFLIGRNEDGRTFAHAVSHAPIFAAIKGGRDVVAAVQDWIFSGDYQRMVRQGDLALIPMKSRPGGTKGQLKRVAVLEGSHALRADQIAVVEGRVYAKNPSLTHLPGTHPHVKADGWVRIVVGKRAEFWKFAAPTVD